MNTHALHEYIHTCTHTRTHPFTRAGGTHARTRVLLPAHGLGMNALTYGRTHSGIWAETDVYRTQMFMHVYLYAVLQMRVFAKQQHAADAKT